VEPIGAAGEGTATMVLSVLETRVAPPSEDGCGISMLSAPFSVWAVACDMAWFSPAGWGCPESMVEATSLAAAISPSWGCESSKSRDSRCKTDEALDRLRFRP